VDGVCAGSKGHHLEGISLLTAGLALDFMDVAVGVLVTELAHCCAGERERRLLLSWAKAGRAACATGNTATMRTMPRREVRSVFYFQDFLNGFFSRVTIKISERY
jgi:hypothetical protein